MATNNGINTPIITLGGAFTMNGGAYTFVGTLSANTAITFPTTGTLITSKDANYGLSYIMARGIY